MEREALRTAILSHITPPAIGSRVVDAKKTGILPDTGKNLRLPLQAAIDELSASGGGRLVLPAGVYLTGALRMKSGVELHLESPYTVLRFINTDIAENYPLVLSHWEASPCYNYSPLLYACDAHDIAITGPGTMDGGADERHWLPWHHQVEKAWSSDKRDMQLEDRSALRRILPRELIDHRAVKQEAQHRRACKAQQRGNHAPRESAFLLPVHAFTIHLSPHFMFNLLFSLHLSVIFTAFRLSALHLQAADSHLHAVKQKPQGSALRLSFVWFTPARLRPARLR